MNKLNFKKLFAEGFLIIFSVLFALYITQLSDSAKLKRNTDEALGKIQQEITSNIAVIKRWKESHGRLLARIDSLSKGQSPKLKEAMLERNFLGFDQLLNGDSFIDAIVSETAWQAAKSTQIISEFSYEEVQELSLIYALQDIILKQTVPKIVDAIFSRESQDLQNLDATLNQLNFLVQELTGQEQVLLNLYDERLTKDQEQD